MGFVKKIKNILKTFSIKLKSKENNKFKGSSNYWENRYQNKNNSGSGSYGRLAKFKAKTLNSFVSENDINSVLEFGCGDGNQLKLSRYKNYIGYDVSKKAISICQNKFSYDDTKKFYHYNAETFKMSSTMDKAELVMSLDVIYHLIEDDVFEDHMSVLFSTSQKYVIIYSSNYNDHFVAHVKCREFTKWIENNVFSNWELLDVIKNEFPFNPEDPTNTSMSDFYIYKKRD